MDKFVGGLALIGFGILATWTVLAVAGILVNIGGVVLLLIAIAIVGAWWRG